ncbi:hypothetical protein RRG08_040298 [Elysia crispata]|uniref:Uncharacterized protein n=1 Tax=Elysia crispata TaxID=231223 RepID=A0AAE0Z2L6_9GAST|nr:hypothetical protein RRG08_040298 [Elysia crispata]
MSLWCELSFTNFRDTPDQTGNPYRNDLSDDTHEESTNLVGDPQAGVRAPPKIHCVALCCEETARDRGVSAGVHDMGPSPYEETSEIY